MSRFYAKVSAEFLSTLLPKFPRHKMAEKNRMNSAIFLFGLICKKCIGTKRAQIRKIAVTSPRLFSAMGSEKHGANVVRNLCGDCLQDVQKVYAGVSLRGGAGHRSRRIV